MMYIPSLGKEAQFRLHIRLVAAVDYNRRLGLGLKKKCQKPTLQIAYLLRVLNTTIVHNCLSIFTNDSYKYNNCVVCDTNALTGNLHMTRGGKIIFFICIILTSQKIVPVNSDARAAICHFIGAYSVFQQKVAVINSSISSLQQWY